MKPITTVLLSILILCSCSSNNKSPTEKQNIKDKTVIEGFKTFDTIVRFSGYWVNETYLKSLQETRSTIIAQGADTKVPTALIIPSQTLQTVGVNWNFNEGDEWTILKDDNTYQAWRYSSMSKEIFQKVYDINIISENRIKIGDTYFRKLSERTREKDDYRFEYHLIGEFLFKGTYSTGAGDIIKFKDNGKVTGLDEFPYYLLELNYWYPGIDIDQIGLKKSEMPLTKQAIFWE